MKKYFALTSLLVIMMLAVSTQLMAQNAEPGATPAGTTEFVVLAPGQSTTLNRVLDAPIQQDKDITLILAQGAGPLHIEVIDCCIMGDTMIGILLAPDASGTWGVIGLDYATSPDVAVIDVSISGLSILITGYLRAPGGFPAGYDILLAR